MQSLQFGVTRQNGGDVETECPQGHLTTDEPPLVAGGSSLVQGLNFLT